MTGNNVFYHVQKKKNCPLKVDTTCVRVCVCAVIRETGNSANISLMNNKSKPCFLVCFLHFWERGDLMKWKLSLQASVARHHAFIIVIILQPGAEATFMRGELENKGELKNKSAVFSRVSRSFYYRTHPTRRHVSRLLKMNFFFLILNLIRVTIHRRSGCTSSIWRL